MSISSESFKYNSISSNPAILGTLEGPCADIVNPTRNGRKYSEELWEKVFSDPIVEEQIQNGGIMGEGMHPLDGREEIDVEKVAIVMKEKPSKKDGKLWAKFQILNTPVGRIIKTLCDAGFNIGVSSRGSGDVITDYNGQESVDPDTYDFKCFDCVLIPAVKAARMRYVSEGLNNKTRKSLREALDNTINNASEKDKKIMIETLNDLQIPYSQSRETVENIKESQSDTSLVTEALTRQKELEKELLAVQEKLSVSYAKEIKLQEELNKYKENAKKFPILIKQNKAMQERLNKLSNDANILKEDYTTYKNSSDVLNSKLTVEMSKNKKLTEQLLDSRRLANNCQSTIVDLKEKLSRYSIDNKKQVEQLREKLSELNKDYTLKTSEYSKKLINSNALVEKYKAIANKAVDKYISSQALKLGISSAEIKNRLPENYSFENIDSVCESLQEHSIGISQLPFQTVLTENMKMSMKPSTNEPILPAQDSADFVDDDLIRLAGLK